MGDDFRKDAKARGRQHLHNKRKHDLHKKAQHKNDKLETNTVEGSSEPINQWESNTWRYETDEAEDTSALTNFEILSQAPISEGGHFQFKSDKQLETPKITEHSCFSLDLTLLARGLETIPFYLRNGLDEKLFDENNVESMKKIAHKHEELYNNYLSNKTVQENTKTNTEIDKTTEIKSAQSVKPKQTNPSISDGDTNIDLEQWLDDILDD